VRLAVRQPRLRLMLALLTAEAAVLGALDLLFVILAGEVNFADRGLQLSRGLRALKVWVAVHTFGLAAFRACIQRNLALAEYAEAATP
jgi:glutamate/tyrosine decarboxylase-like PLP-dependent enzyme